MTRYFLNNTEYNGRYVNLSWVYGPPIPASSLRIWQVHIYTYLFNPHAALCFHHPTDWLLFFQPWFVEIYNYNLLPRPKQYFGLRSLVWTASLVKGSKCLDLLSLFLPFATVVPFDL